MTRAAAIMLWLLLLYACCASSAAVEYHVLPCGGTHVLNATSMFPPGVAESTTLLLKNCTEDHAANGTVYVFGAAHTDTSSTTDFRDMRLLISNSYRVSVVVQNASLRNVTISFINVTDGLRGCAPTCVERRALVSIISSLVFESSVAIQNATFFEDVAYFMSNTSNLTSVNVAVNGCVQRGRMSTAMVSIVDSSLSHGTVSIAVTTAALQIALVHVARSVVNQSHVMLADCNLTEERASGTSRMFPLAVVAIFNSSLLHSLWSMRNLTVVSMSESTHRIVAVNRTTTEGVTIALRGIRAVNVGLWSIVEKSLWGSSLVSVEGFEMYASHVGTLLHAAEVEDSVLLHSSVLLADGLIVFSAVSSVALWRAAGSHVQSTLVVLDQIAMTTNTSLLVTDFVLSVSLEQSTMRNSTLSMLKLAGAADARTAKLSLRMLVVQTMDTDLLVSACDILSIHVERCVLNSSQLRLDALVCHAAADALLRMASSDVSGTNITATDCSVSSSMGGSGGGWYTTNTRFGASRVVWRRVQVVARGDAFVDSGSSYHTGSWIRLEDCNLTLTALDNALVFFDTTLTDTNLEVIRSHVATNSSFAFGMWRNTIQRAAMLFEDSQMSVKKSYAWTLFDSQMQNSSIVLRRCRMFSASHSFGMWRNGMMFSTHILLDACNATAAVQHAVAVYDMPAIVSCRFEVILSEVTCHAGSSLSMWRNTLSATNIAVTDSRVSATGSYGFAFYDSPVSLSAIRIQRSEFTAAMYAFAVWGGQLSYAHLTLEGSSFTARQQFCVAIFSTALASCSVAIENCSASAVTTFAVLLYESSLSATTIMVQRSRIIAGGGQAFLLWRINAAAVAVLVEGCNITATERGAVVTWETTWTQGNLTFRNTTAVASAEALSLVESTFAYLYVIIESCSLSASNADGVLVYQTFLTNSVLDVLRAAVLSKGSYAFTFDNSSLTSTDMMFLDSVVTAGRSFAWATLSTFLSNCTVFFDRCAATASSFGMRFEGSDVSATNITVVRCNISAAARGGWMTITSRFNSAVITLDGTCITTSQSYALAVQTTELTATAIVVSGCNITSSGSNAMQFQGSTCTRSTVALRDSLLTSLSGAFRLEETNLSTSTVTVMDSTLHAATSFAWAVLVLVSSSSAIGLQRSLLSAADFTWILENATLVNDTSISLVDCNITATGTASGGAAVVVYESKWHSCTFLLHGLSLTYAGIGDDRSAVVYFSLVAMRDAAVWTSNCTLHAVHQAVLWRFVHTTLSRSAINVSSTVGFTTSSVVAVLRSNWSLVSLMFADVLLVCGAAPLVLFDSCANMHLRYFAIVATNVTYERTSGSNDVVGVVASNGSSRVVLDYVLLDVARFAGFDAVFEAESPSSTEMVVVTVFCSWWSSSRRPPKWGPLTKLVFGASVETEKPPQYETHVSSLFKDALCPAVSLTHTASETSASVEVNSSTHTLPVSVSARSSSASGSATPWQSRTATVRPSATEMMAGLLVRRLQPTSVQYAAYVGAAVAASSFASVTCGLFAQRLAFVIRSSGKQCSATQSDALTEADAPVDWLSSPTRLEIGSGAGSQHLGAVVGNTIACIGWACAGVLAVILVGHKTHSRFAAVATQLCLRHFVSVSMFVLVQPTLTSATILLHMAVLLEGTEKAVAAIVGAFGVAVAAGAVAALAVVLGPSSTSFRARPEPLPSAPRFYEYVLASANGFLPLRVWRWWTARSVVWRPKAGHSSFVLNWGFLFDEVREKRHVWPLWDVTVSLIMGALAAAAPSTPDGCAIWKWSVVLVACAALLAPLVATPFHSPCSATLYVVMASLIALLAVLSAVDASPTAVEGISIASAVAPWVFLLLQGVRLFQRRGSWGTDDASVAAEPHDSAYDAEETPTHRSQGGSGKIFTQSRRQEPRERDARRSAGLGSAKPPSVLRALVVLICSHQQRARLVTRSKAIVAKFEPLDPTQV